MEEITNWRQWIRELPPDARKKLSAYLKVDRTALTKWTQGHRTPRIDHLYDLALYNPALRPSLEREYPDAFKGKPEFMLRDIPVSFYQEILQILTMMADAVAGRAIAKKVFEAMSRQLDPAETGLFLMPSLFIAEQMLSELITIMHTGEGYCTGIFHCPQENEYYEVGRDSLAGLAVTRRRVVLYPQTGILAHCPTFSFSDKIASAAAFPSWRRGKLAGALFVASVHHNFFTAERVELCTHYAELYSLSLHDDQFYDPRRIALRVMREGLDIPEPNGV